MQCPLLCFVSGTVTATQTVHQVGEKKKKKAPIKRGDSYI